MKIYFLSSQPCALSFNGVHFGVTNLFERFAKISPQDNLFVEFLPQNAQPIRFFLTEKIRFSPPLGCEVYLLPNALAIYARDFPPINTPLRLITQKRCGNTLASVFQQGDIQLSIQTEESAFIATLPPSFANCEIDFYANLCFIFNEKQLAIYTKTGKRVFLEEIISFSVEENTLNATLPLSTLLGAQAICAYTLTDDTLTQTNFSVQSHAPEGAIMEDFLPYLFFEKLLNRLNITPYLAEELIESEGKLQDFLGDFIHVVCTDNPKIIGLVYKKANDLFQVHYFETEIEQGKIANISPCNEK